MTNSHREIGLAPMEGVTDLATRLWFALVSTPAFMCTPFWRVCYPQLQRAVGDVFAPELDRLKHLVPYRLIPQIMSDNADAFCDAAELLLPKTPFVDLNCGCPSPTVVGNGAGSSLLQSRDVFGGFLERVRTRLTAEQWSVKMRTGFDAEPDNFSALLEILAGLPLARLTVHARTRLQRYSGAARWDLIGLAAASVPFPVFGSGDICNYESFQRLTQATPGLTGVIIGRGALRNPWIFSEISKKEEVCLSIDVLLYSLAVFAILQSLLRDQPAKLLQMADEGLFLLQCGNDEQRWQVTYEKICTFAYGKLMGIEKLEFEGRILSRVKMLWNYLRSSFPEDFFAPAPLRTSSFADFVAALRQFDSNYQTQTSSNNRNLYVLSYNSQRDWLYSGAGRS